MMKMMMELLALRCSNAEGSGLRKGIGGENDSNVEYVRLQRMEGGT